MHPGKLLTSQSVSPTRAATPLPALIAKAAASAPPVVKLLFVRSADAHPLWPYFFRALEGVLCQRYGMNCTWLCLGDAATGLSLEDLELVKEAQLEPRVRSLAVTLRQHRPHVVHALGTRASVLCQVARMLVYPPPTLLSFPGETDQLAGPMERWLERRTRDRVDRYIVATHEDRQRLLHAGFAPHKTTVIPLATRAAEFAASRTDLRAAAGADALLFVMATAFGLATTSDPQWVALEILAEMLHRGIPSILLATAPEAARTAVCEYAERLQVATHLRLLSPWTDTQYAVAAADVVLLPSSSAAATWLALAAVDSGTPVVKSPRVRLPRLVTELPAANDHIHPLAREDLHTWLDTMEDFRPRATRAIATRQPPSPALPPLDAVAREYVALYHFLRSRNFRRR